MLEKVFVGANVIIQWMEDMDAPRTHLNCAGRDCKMVGWNLLIYLMVIGGIIMFVIPMMFYTSTDGSPGYDPVLMIIGTVMVVIGVISNILRK